MFERFFNFVVDKILRIETVAVLCCALGAFVLSNGIDYRNKQRQERRSATEFCYSQNMVLIDSDAGKRCVQPSALVRIDND